MSNRLLAQYIRTILEAHLARVPNQLVSTSDHEGERNEDTEDVNEFAACGAGGGNTLGSGNIVGYSAPLGMNPDKLGRKKNAGKRKRVKKTHR